METTFITIHDLTEDARILYASDSIVDILGHTPDEVVNKPTWDFFHPDEVQGAMNFHEKGIELDKAAVLAYCQIRNRQGHYLTCECCFSICYDVMVCCTSIYRHGFTSQKRAVEAPIVRRMFTSSPKDPRYHMLTHLSSKFQQNQQEQTHEPRAALFLNRFTRTLTIMYATSGVEEIIGVSGEEMKGKSFYYCIAENCLEDAVKCLETAKGNDSIAYLRFWFRDPRTEDRYRDDSPNDESDVAMTDITSTEDESEGTTTTGSEDHATSRSTSDAQSRRHADGRSASDPSREGASRPSRSTTDGNSTSQADSASVASSDQPARGVELEAVVSCTSDGLVVCLRRARPLMPQSTPSAPSQPALHPQAHYGPGIFAAPWGINPILPAPYPQTPYIPATAAPPPAQAAVSTNPRGPPQSDFLKAISDVAVFAWALAGINGSLADFSHGKPGGESAPPEGYSIWTPLEKQESHDSGFEQGNDPLRTPGSGSGFGYGSGSSGGSGNGNGNGRRDPFGDPGLASSGSNGHGRPWLS